MCIAWDNKKLPGNMRWGGDCDDRALGVPRIVCTVRTGSASAHAVQQFCSSYYGT